MDTYVLLVKDNDTGAPVPGAEITFTSAAGELIGNLITGTDGRASFDADANPYFVFDGTMVRATAPGYGTLGINGANLENEWYFSIAPDAQSNTLEMIGAGIAIGLLGYRLWLHFKKR